MKKLLSLLMLLIVTSQQAQTQSGISGDWRAASVLPDGTPDAAIREFNLELEASGTSVKGTVTGTSIVIREGPSTSLFSPTYTGFPVSGLTVPPRQDPDRAVMWA